MMFGCRILPGLVAGALLVAGCGDDNTSGGDSAARGNSVDRAFVAQMVPHHEMAVQMARIAQRRGSSAFVKRLADDIVRTQTAEISTLRATDQRLKTAGVGVGSLGVPQHMMGMEDDPSSLNTAKPFDPAFVKMMIPHHEGAIEMADAELETGKDPELRTLAQKIRTAQHREITEMRQHLDGRGAAMSGSSDEHRADHSG